MQYFARLRDKKLLDHDWQFSSVQYKVDSSLAKFIPFFLQTCNGIAARGMIWVIHNTYNWSLEITLQVDVLKTISQSDVMQCGTITVDPP